MEGSVLLEGAAFVFFSGRRKWCPEHSEDVTVREKGGDFPDGAGEVGESPPKPLP